MDIIKKETHNFMSPRVSDVPVPPTGWEPFPNWLYCILLSDSRKRCCWNRKRCLIKGRISQHLQCFVQHLVLFKALYQFSLLIEVTFYDLGREQLGYLILKAIQVAVQVGRKLCLQCLELVRRFIQV